jgi:hypothetical protein
MIDKEMLREQADMWQWEKELFDQKEKLHTDALKKELAENRQFLKKQIELKYQGGGMSQNEFLMNKKILEKAQGAG